MLFLCNLFFSELNGIEIRANLGKSNLTERDDQRQILITSRFWDAASLLNVPKLALLSGQTGTISIGKEKTEEEQEFFDGCCVSFLPSLREREVLIEGWVFYGSGRIKGKNGFDERADLTLLKYNKRQNQMPELTGKESFAWNLEMNGMFQLKGVPHISLNFKGRSSFWLKKGEVKNGIRIIHFEGEKPIPHVILEKNGLLAQINLSSQGLTSIPYLQNMPGGGIVFSLRAVPGEVITLPVLGTTGKLITMEISAEVF